MNSFQLDARLATDTVFIATRTLCEIRLMNDRRWPWLILVPRIEGAEEIHDLPVSDQGQLATETSRVAAALKTHTKCTKINTGALGNMVRQLHIHVIARNENDPNWPGPVWGYGRREEYGRAELEEIVRRLQKVLDHNQNRANL
jgi:diadenosine tetraphosphate (Ap4A) HIT family hydrolase